MSLLWDVYVCYVGLMCPHMSDLCPHMSVLWDFYVSFMSGVLWIMICASSTTPDVKRSAAAETFDIDPSSTRRGIY